jgi:hypothetical protein
MKTKLIITIACCLCGLLRAQTPTSEIIPKKQRVFESGMNLYTMNFIGSDYHMQYSNQGAVDQFFFNGFYFKFFKGKNALRVLTNYFQKINEFDNTYMYPYYLDYAPTGRVTGTYKAGDFKIGYQRLFGSKKLSAYFFADVHYSYSQLKGDYSGMVHPCYTSYCVPYSLIRYPESYLIERSQFGLVKGLGLRWCIANRLTLNLETNFETYYFMQEDIKNSRSKQQGAGFTYNPLQFSLGFVF